MFPVILAFFHILTYNTQQVNDTNGEWRGNISKTTDELLKILKRAKQPVEYIESQKEELSTKTLDQLLEEYMEKYKVEKAEVIKRSGLDRTYAYQIFSGRKQPSRNKLLALGIAIGMELDELLDEMKQSILD